MMFQIKLMAMICAYLGMADVTTMIRMDVRLMGPGIRPGSNAALPKVIYRAGFKYARMEDAPEAKQRIQKITIISEPDAYSIDLNGKVGTHVIHGGDKDVHLPIVLPFDPNRKLGDLDSSRVWG